MVIGFGYVTLFAATFPAVSTLSCFGLVDEWGNCVGRPDSSDWMPLGDTYRCTQALHAISTTDSGGCTGCRVLAQRDGIHDLLGRGIHLIHNGTTLHLASLHLELDD